MKSSFSEQWGNLHVDPLQGFSSLPLIFFGKESLSLRPNQASLLWLPRLTHFGVAFTSSHSFVPVERSAESFSSFSHEALMLYQTLSSLFILSTPLLLKGASFEDEFVLSENFFMAPSLCLLSTWYEKSRSTGWLPCNKEASLRFYVGTPHNWKLDGSLKKQFAHTIRRSIGKQPFSKPIQGQCPLIREPHDFRHNI